MTKAIPKSFRARLEKLGPGLNWVIANVPFNVRKRWGMGGRPKVKGEINGFAFRTSLFPRRDGTHFVLVNKKMQRGARVSLGMVAQFTLKPDLDERVVTVPKELMHELAQDRSLARWFEKLNYSMRRYIAEWITEVKSPAARVRRAQQIAERLLETMEAERELPPMLKLAFAHHQRAREGWAHMSAGRRRQHLLGIFYYRDPESRARRAAKAVEDAAAVGERLAQKTARS